MSSENNDLHVAIPIAVYRFRGGAPPYRGFHLTRSWTVTPHEARLEGTPLPSTQDVRVPADRKVEHLKDAIAEAIPHMFSQLNESIEVFQGDVPSEFNQPETSVQLMKPDPTQTIGELVKEGITVAILIPMAPGKVDIGTWTVDAGVVGSTMLRADTCGAETKVAGENVADEDPAATSVDVAREILFCFKGNPNAASSPIMKYHGDTKEQPGPLLSSQQCAALVGHLEAACVAAEALKEIDFQLIVTTEDLLQLCGEGAVETLASCFGQTEFTAKLRRVRAAEVDGQGRAENSKAINFHLDAHARTMQVFLNGEDDYEGGKVVYATAQGLVCPPRPAGCATVHDRTVPHGVTALKRGTRYSLFLLGERGHQLRH